MYYIRLKKLIKKNLNSLTGRKLFKNKLPPPESIGKILFISLYFKGDLLFHSAFLKALKGVYKNAKIDVWVKSRSLDVIENNPDFNELLVFDDIRTAKYREGSNLNLKGKIGFLKNIRSRKYDVIFDLTGKYNTALYTLFSKAKYSVGINYNFFGFCYDRFVSLDTSTEPGHLIDKYLSVLPSGLKLDDKFWEEVSQGIDCKPYIHINNSSKQYIDGKLKELMITGDRPFITLHATSGWKAKELDAAVFADLIKYLQSKNYNFIFVGDEKDIEKLKHIRSFLNENDLDLEKNFLLLNFNMTAELIRRSDLFIGSDSAPLHAAGAVGTPTIGIFGPTNPEFSRPLGKQHQVIYHRLSCSSAGDRQYCTLNGGMTCPTVDCMKMISADQIAALIERSLQNTKDGTW